MKSGVLRDMAVVTMAMLALVFIAAFIGGAARGEVINLVSYVDAAAPNTEVDSLTASSGVSDVISVTGAKTLSWDVIAFNVDTNVIFRLEAAKINVESHFINVDPNGNNITVTTDEATGIYVEIADGYRFFRLRKVSESGGEDVVLHSVVRAGWGGAIE